MSKCFEKHLFVESKNGIPKIQEQNFVLLKLSIETYKEFAQTEKGSLLLAVARGKVSEGIDFVGKECRMIIITGIPYAPPGNDRMNYCKANNISYDKWLKIGARE